VQREDANVQPEETGVDVQPARTGRNLIVAVVACVAFALLAVASPHVSAWARGLGGTSSFTPAVQAYFPDPSKVNRGIQAGRPVTFAVRTSTPAHVTWSASAGTHRLGTGVVATGVRTVQITIPTRTAPRRAWLVIRVGGAAIPLRVWLR
jgi:hypothetical protein